jgi:type IV pilus modification protein PilV
MAHRISMRVPHREAGFSIIEALISLLVVAFGLLAIASFQYTLSRASDVAKQRTEATRIAQREMDRLRSFGQRQSDGNLADTRYTYVDDIVSGSQTLTGLTTNTTYTMNTTVGVPPAPASGDRFRWVNIVVGWADRVGQQQSVQLSSVISDGDPGDLGPLGVRRRTSATLRPKNRNINVPYPSVNLATCPAGSAGCSAFVPPPGNVAYVFDNVSGNVIQSCTLTQYSLAALTRTGGTATANVPSHPFTNGSWVEIAGATPLGYNGQFRVGGVVASTSFAYPVSNSLATPAAVTTATARWALIEGIDLANLPGGVNCTTLTNEAYLLSGYVRFVTSGTPNADDIINTSGVTFDLRSTGPLTITTSAGQAPSGYTCYAQRQKVVAANSSAPSRNISSYSRTGNVVSIVIAGNSNHGFVPGMVIAVTGTSNYFLQGQFEISSVSGNTLTYAEIGADVGTTSGGRVELIQQLTLAEDEPAPPAYNDNQNNRVSTFVAYTCVVTPSTTGTPREWWGRLDLVPETDPAREEWSTSSHRVCRYTADYNLNGLSNSDHPRYYRQVTGTLDNQNFVVIPAAANCPTDTPPTYTGNQAGNYNNTNTAAHQPTAADSPGEPNADNQSIAME